MELACVAGGIRELAEWVSGAEPPYSLREAREEFRERRSREWNSTLHQSSHGFATRVHGFATKTKGTRARIPASYAG